MTHAAHVEQLADTIAAAIAEVGWCVVDTAMPEPLVARLAAECNEAAAAFTPAGTGRRQQHQRDASVRSDAIRWLDTAASPDADYLVLMGDLRAALNSRLFLGLFAYESHYAQYAAGAFYRRHVDAFAGDKNRVLSTVLYLNPQWQQDEGGALLLYAADGERPLATVLPQYNRLVVFLSERFPHEVTPATRARHSIAGWFRIRA